VFEGLEDGVAMETVAGIYRALIETRPGSVRTWEARSRFLDIGTPKDCLETSLALARTEGPRLAGARCRIHETAEILGSVLWDDVTVGAGAGLRDCIVGDGAQIPPGARYERCAIVPAHDRIPGIGERLDDQLLVKALD